MAKGLLEDILRYIQHHPVQACAAAVGVYVVMAAGSNGPRRIDAERTRRDDAIIAETQAAYDPFTKHDFTGVHYAA